MRSISSLKDKALVYDLFDFFFFKIIIIINAEGCVQGYRFWMCSLSVGSQMLVFFLSRRLSCRIDHMHQCNVFLAAGNSVTVLQVCVHCYKAAKVSSLTLSVCELV